MFYWANDLYSQNYLINNSIPINYILLPLGTFIQALVRHRFRIPITKLKSCNFKYLFSYLLLMFYT